MNVLVKIERKWKVPKAISVPLILAMITGITMFIWKNVSPPKVEEQIGLINVNQRSLISKDSSKTIQFELMKHDIKTVINNQCDLKEATEKGFDRMEKRLDALFSACNRNNPSMVRR